MQEVQGDSMSAVLFNDGTGAPGGGIQTLAAGRHPLPGLMGGLTVSNSEAPRVAKFTTMFDKDEGLLFTALDAGQAEIATFLIPWHDIGEITDRMHKIEAMKLDRDAGISEF